MTTLVSVASCEVQVLEAFARYEEALVRGDVAVMTELFADSPDLVRFGITDTLRPPRRPAHRAPVAGVDTR